MHRITTGQTLYFSTVTHATTRESETSTENHQLCACRDAQVGGSSFYLAIWHWCIANVDSEYLLRASSNRALLHVGVSEASTTSTRPTEGHPRSHQIRVPTPSRPSRPIGRVHALLLLGVLPPRAHIVVVRASVVEHAHVHLIEGAFPNLQRKPGVAIATLTVKAREQALADLEARRGDIAGAPHHQTNLADVSHSDHALVVLTAGPVPHTS